MPQSKKENLLRILKKLTRIGYIEGSAIVTVDGLMIASDLSKDLDSETMAAMSASMFGAAETAISGLSGGGIERVIAEGNQTKLITTGAGQNAGLASMVNKKANLGLILVEMKRTAHMIEEEME